jgi:hypothetical protein
VFTEKLSEYYTKLEDKYFNTLDFLDEKGIPVYTYSDFFEEKGIPSFIVTIAIFILIISMIFVTLNGGFVATDSILLTLQDEQGNPLNNVMVAVYNANTNELIKKAELKSNGEIINLPPLSPGTRLRLVASKTDYGEDYGDIMLGSEQGRVAIALARQLTGINAEIVLIDGETNTRIKNASVFVIWKERQFKMTVDSNGNYTQSGIPEGQNVTVKVSAEGYNEIEQQVIFYANSPRTISLTPSTQGFVGKATFVVLVNNSEQTSIEGALVKIYDKTNEIILLEDVTIQGVVSGQIQTGIPLRVVIEKEGYLKYDSEIEGTSLTLREKEKQFIAELRQGGEKLTVNAVNNLGLSMDEVHIQLFSLDGHKIDESHTEINGCEFIGLDINESIIVTAWKEGYLPQRKIIKISNTESVELLLETALAGNSLRLDIYTTDTKGEAINNAKVILFDYDTDGNLLPTGINTKSNVGGFVPTVVQLNKNYVVLAETEIYQGQTNVEAIGNNAIPVYVRMSKKPKIVELFMMDTKAREIFGTAVVDGLDGLNLYDGNIQDSRIFFNAEGRETIELSVLQLDGNIFTENIYVKDKDYVEVTIYNRDSDEFAPAIEFIGLENERGEPVYGITPGAFYWAKFSVAFPLSTNSGGVHFRTGNDNLEFVDSDNIALYELSMQGSTNVYSFSYIKNPAPGNEVIDRANLVLQGEKAKWVEGSLIQPKGTYTAKVKIRVNDFTAGNVSINYRAWANIENDYYRTPKDNDLERNAFSQNKSGLYATTIEQQLKLYESLPECNDNICMTTNIIDTQDVFYDVEGFEALNGKMYAFEVELTTKEADYIDVSVTGNDSIKFISTQTTPFSWPEIGTESKTAGTGIVINQEDKQKLRFYFVAKEIGSATIDLLISGSSIIEKQSLFKVVEQKKLLVEVNPDNVILGRNFTVKVLDSGLNGVENALIKIIDKEGKVVSSISGSEGIGQNGNYRITNNLITGLYSVEVSAPKTMTEVVPLLITTKDVLSFPKEIYVKMAFNEISTIINEQLINNSEFFISNISIETTDSENFVIETSPPSILTQSQSTEIPIQIKFNGKVSDSADETIDLKISGFVEGKFYTIINTQLNVIYNRKLDSSCLKIEPAKVTMNLIGQSGATDSDSVEVTNNCEQAVFLKHRVSEKTKKSYIIVTSQDISLQPGETQNIIISANNLIDRQYSKDQSFNYEIVFDSNYLKKTLPVIVRTINPMFALSYPGQITMFLAQNSSSGKATAAQPLFVTNVSDFQVDGINFVIDKEYTTTSGLTLRVEPPGEVNLEKKQSITPPKYIFAQGALKDSKPAVLKIQITGKMSNLNNQSGQRDNYDYYENYYNGTAPLSTYTPKTNNYSTGNQVLGEINVMIYYSGFDCLTVAPTDDLTYILSGPSTPISRRISITNNCAEPIRVTGATTRTPDIFASVFPAPILQPNQGAEVRLSIMTLKDSLNLTGHPIEITAIADLSQTPLQTRALPIDLFVGADFSSQYGKVLKGISANVCGQQEKIKIDVPKLASGTDCAQGYCDAENAAEYIAKKLDRIIRNAESQGYSKQNIAEGFGCAGKGYCTFSELGIKNDPFDLYLMSDRVSTEAIRNVLTKGKSGTTSGFIGGTISTGEYLIEPFDVTNETIASVARSGYNRRIFLDNALSGCGYYKIQVDGAFSVFGGTIQFDRPVIVVRAQDFEGNKRIDTKECATNIINLQNHAPIDKGYSVSENKGSWLTTIEAEPNLEDIAKSIAKSFLKSEDRTTSFGPGNTLKLIQAPLVDTLAEMCILGDEKKTITIKVDSGLMQTTGTEQENFKKQIARMVSDALSGNFGEANCFTQGTNGYDCLKLNDLSKIGALKMIMPNKTMHLDNAFGCIKTKIISSLAENIEFEISTGEKFEGVRKIQIKSLEQNEEKIYAEFNYNGVTLDVQKNESVRLEKGFSQEEPYSKEFLVCAYSNDDQTSTNANYLQAHDSTFTVLAINKAAGIRKTNDLDGKINISVGTIHPNDLITRLIPPTSLKKGQNYPYYFTIMWDGGPDAIIYDEYLDGLKKLQNIDNVIINTENSGKAGTTKFDDIEDSGKAKAIGSYFGACFITSGICNGIPGGLIGGSLSALADCGIPAITIFRTDLVQAIEPLEEVYDFIGNIFPIAKIHSDPTYSPATWDPIILGSGIGGIEAMFTGSTPRLWGGVNTGNIGWATSQVKETYTNTAKTTLRNVLDPSVSDDVVNHLANSYGETLSRRFNEGLNNNYKDAMKRKGIINKKFVNAHNQFNETASKTLGQLNTPESMGKFLTEIDPTTGKQYIEALSPTQNVEELLNKFKSNDLKNLIGQMKTFDTGALETNISRNLDNLAITKKGGQRLLSRDLTNADLRQIITDSVNQTAGPNVSINTKQQLVNNIMSDTYIDNLQNFTKNTQISDITKKIGNSTRARVGELDDLARITSQQVNDLGAKVGSTIQNNIPDQKDISKIIKNRTKMQKFKQLLSSKKFWGSLGWGVICGATSNAAGMFAYNQSMKTTNRASEAESIQIADPSFVFVKGKTYKMVISDSEVGEKVRPIFSEVINEQSAKMIEYLSKEENKEMRLISKEDSEKQSPDKRKLQLYLIKTNPIIAEREMKQQKKYTDNDKALLKNEIGILIKSDVQQLINKYTALQVADAKRKIKVDNSNRLFEGTQYATEAHVISVILQLWRQQDFDKDVEITKELAQNDGIIKQKIKTILKEQLEAGVTSEVGEKVFPGKGEEFSQRVSMWHQIEINSIR